MALSVARQVLGGEATRGGDVVVAWDSSYLDATRSEDSAPTFYVVTPTLGGGFVIVAGDDVITPVLAYSDCYSASFDGVLPPSFEAWLHYVDDAVRFARENGITADEETIQRWGEWHNPIDAILLNTARWSQSSPYNMYCPMDSGVNSVTGCTQTAMAEIMHHHRWPEAAKGTTEPFVTSTHGISVGARDLNHSYDWDNMLDEYTADWSEVEAEAVAVLMADLGHSNKADYGADGTGALPDMEAMYVNYGYSPACHYMMRDNYSSEGWNDLMRAEIEASRPVLYSGYTVENFGHAFVLDGIDANNYFHINWGWGGVFDGFFMFDNLVVDTYDFAYTQWAFLGFHPMRDGEIDNWLYVASPGISVYESEFATNVPFQIDYIPVVNLSMLDFKGEVRVGVCDINGLFKSWATESLPFELPSNYMDYCDAMEAVITEEIAGGDHLRVFYRSQSSSEWFCMIPSSDYTQYEVLLRHPSIGDTTSLEFNSNSGIMHIRYDADVEAALYLDGVSVDTGVTIARGCMVVNTSLLQRDVEYTIYLERAGVESKELKFTLNKM